MKYSDKYRDDVRRACSKLPDISPVYGKRILISGATGMLCSAVVDVIAFLNREKKAGIKLILAGRSREKIAERFRGVLSEDDFEYVFFDAAREDEPDVKCDYIIHGASNADPAKIAAEPVETMLENVLGLRSMLEIARDNKGSRLLFISSGEVYGRRSDGDNEPSALTEDKLYDVDILNPRSSYPLGKRSGESLCSCYISEYGVDAVIARSCHSFGPGITLSDSRATACFTRDAAAGRNIVMKSSGEQVRSYCYSLDSATALLTILVRGQCGSAYNIANRDIVVSIREMAEALAGAGGVKVVFEKATDAEKKSYNLMNYSALDPSKLESLGWSAAFDLKSAVKATLENY